MATELAFVGTDMVEHVDNSAAWLGSESAAPEDADAVMSKRMFFVFVVVQGLGVMGAVLWSFTYSAAGPWLWMMGFFLMFPGNFAAASLVDATLWGSDLSLRALSVVTLALAVATNAATWTLARWGIRRFARARARVKPS